VTLAEKGWEIAYLAGFFDGEGFIIICKDKSRVGNVNYRVRIGVSQVVVTPILLFKEYFGGLIQYQKRPESTKHRDIFTWQQHSQKAAYALTTMLPYLTVKREQAEFALNFIGINKKFQGRLKTPNDLIWCEEQKALLSKMKGYL
jgi:hypothetical protein